MTSVNQWEDNEDDIFYFTKILNKSYLNPAVIFEYGTLNAKSTEHRGITSYYKILRAENTKEYQPF